MDMNTLYKRVEIKCADMPEEMQQEAIVTSLNALEKCDNDRDIAAFIKKDFDKKFNPTWHCIVGTNYGAYVTHESKYFFYFSIEDSICILIFKSA